MGPFLRGPRRLSNRFRQPFRYAPLGVIVTPTGEASANESDVAARVRNLQHDLPRQFAGFRRCVGKHERVVARMQDQGGDTYVRDKLPAAAARIVIIHTLEAVQRRRDPVIEQPEGIELIHIDAQWRSDACKLTPIRIPEAVDQVTLLESGESFFQTVGGGIESKGH